MSKTAAVVFLSLLVLALGACWSSSCVFVEVRPADGPRLIVPVPLAVARATLAFAPREAAHVQIPELDEYADDATQLVDELLDAPDGVLVEVHDATEYVWIAKVGSDLEIEVETREEDVTITLPLEAAAKILESYDGDELETREVLDALETVSRRNLVHVRTPEDEVRVWIW